MIFRSDGYIALISAVVISALLIIITFAVGFSSFFARFNILDSEYKKVSFGLAEACVDTAILEIAKDNDWTPAIGGTLVEVSGLSKTCKVCEVASAGGKKTIYARAAYGNPKKTHTHIVAVVTPSASDITIDSWEETPNYTGSLSCSIP